jgi:amino acid transporter
MASKPRVFVRDATGLVREISAFDAFIGNFGVINIPLGLLTFTTAEFIFPGGNMVWASLLATVLSIFPAFIYTLLTWAMPRSGGDYVFVSRIIHPIVGFIVNFGIVFWYIFFCGILANWVATLALSPSMLVIGTVTGNAGLVNIANTIAQPTYTLLVGLIVIAFLSAVMALGVRATFRVTKIAILLMAIGLAIAAWLMISNTNANFIQDFAQFGDYNKVIAAAHALGYSPTSSNNFIATLGVMPFIWGSIGFGTVTCYFAGEAKSVKKTAFYSQVGSTFVAGLILAFFGGLAVAIFGYDFLGSMAALSFSASSAYPFTVSPYLNLYVSMLTSNPVLLWLLGAGYVAGFIADALICYVLASRSIFAWSFDRIIPSKFADISERYRSPLYAILLIAIINIIALVWYTYESATFTSLVSGSYVGFVLMFLIVMITGIVFPFAKKQFYDKSPADIKVAGVPIITIFGIVAAGLYVLLEYFFISNPLYGANAPIVFETIAISILIPMAIFAVALYYRKKQGLNLLNVFKEIPPE